MQSDPQDAAGAVLSPRAGLAMLTLQLRSAVQEAQSAEAELASIDEGAAREELRGRLTPLLAERRTILENSLTAVREEAAAEVAAARRAAEVMLATANAPAATPAEWVVAPTPVTELEPPEGLIPLGQLTPTFAPQVDPPPPLPPVVPVVESLPVVAQPAAAPMNIGIDAEAFARVFAAVFAAMLDERLAGTPMIPSHHLAALAATAPVAPKKGFWASALHVDVLLLGAAMVIMMVVLAAWLA